MAAPAGEATGTAGGEAAGGPAEAPARSAAARGARGDLQLLRSDAGLLLRCAAGLVLIFLVYTSVLILLGRTDVYLIWLWIPAVLTGVTIGGLLDRAHRRRAGQDRSAS